MPNTKSAKKALRSSLRKKENNLSWKSRIASALKSIKKGISSSDEPMELLSKKLTLLQKSLDKASKEKVIHKNKANRLKSKYAKKLSALAQKQSKPAAKEKSSKSK